MPFSEGIFNQLGLFVAAALTLITLSYAFRDHAIFRGVLYLFIGVAAGYTAAIAFQDVILPYLIYPIIDELTGTPALDLVELGVRAVISLFLITKLSPRAARLGSPITALLAGVGAALAIGGAVQGTLLPQINSAATVFDSPALQVAWQGGYYGESLQIIFQGIIAILATVSTLVYFHFGARSRGNQPPQRNALIDGIAWLGALFIAIALAALFTGVLQAALGALVERITFLRDYLIQFLGQP